MSEVTEIRLKKPRKSDVIKDPIICVACLATADSPCPRTEAADTVLGTGVCHCPPSPAGDPVTRHIQPLP